jgi:hypothetical protein
MRRKVTLAARTGLEAPTVLGHVFGDWAATPRWNSDDTFGPEWRVTHVPSGLALNECYLGELSEVEARRIAEALHAARLPSPPLAEQPDGNGYPQAPHDYRWMVEAVVAEVWS